MIEQDKKIKMHDLILPHGLAEILGLEKDQVAKLIETNKIDTHEFLAHQYIILNEKARSLLRNSK